MTLRSFSSPAGSTYGVYPTTPTIANGYALAFTVTHYGWTVNAYGTTVLYGITPTFAISPPVTGQLWPRSAQKNGNFS